MNKIYKPFQFKQFNLQQNHAAMKIGTDGILLGAWVNVNQANHGIDIGTGTGVIALMQVQKNQSLIMDCIEIESSACLDASINLQNSPWSDRLNLYNTSLIHFKPQKKYDCIISNPPFFESSLKGSNKNRVIARHTHSLHYEEILFFSKKNLSENGALSIILPTKQAEECIIKAKECGLFLNRKCNVFPNPTKEQHRTLLEFSNNKTNIIEDNINIETGIRHDYTKEYKELTKNFYIIFD